MDCAALASAVPATPGADGANSPASGCDAAATHFQEALGRPDGGDVYIDGTHTAALGNPLVGVMNAFDSLKLTPETSHRAGSADNRNQADDWARDDGRDEATAEGDGFSEFGDTLLAVQSQILRTTLMMETMNTAKQGVTTVFQQQG